ncbi:MULTISPECIES: GyrI-like domain-containing protein [unclassified Leptospira]|uniref:GyrI-like domain-containing protein n=1 Tax=unclassified Leptospira TaxID=2633828 RepID=UPI0002BEB41C|nr:MULTISPECIES: GyrI-like domain-containing protein [unclassified Leptospira]EMK01435.1 GyrI-like small molecule binding domain protein [Leptospira sp. B5-022]MCR1794418.1 GyrI-like domain-containing protein [Leptospira sp. id769339]
MKSKIFLGVILTLIVSGIGYFYYLGAFDTVQVKEETLGPFYVLSHERMGNYRNVGETFEVIQKEFPEKGFKNYKLFGIYKDNPNTVPEEKLRCEVGALFSEPIADVPAGFSLPLKYRIIEKKKYLTVDFPLKSFVSIFLGIFKVYPVLTEACIERGCNMNEKGSIEIYEPLVEKKTKYLFPLE